MEAKSNKLDEKLYKAMLNLPILPFYGLVKQDKENLEQIKQEFLKTNQSPIFTYSRADKYDVEAFLSALEAFEKLIPELSDNEILTGLYKKKCAELHKRADLIGAIQKKDSKSITKISEELFSTPKQNSKELEAEFQDMLANADEFFEHSKPIDTEIFIKLAQEVLEHYKLNDWRIKVYKGASIKINHGSRLKTPIIRIPEDLNVSKARAARLLTHEIEIHALRTQNGIDSPLYLLKRGLDNYLLTEEGLASYFQQKLSNEPRKHKSGFWDAWTIALTQVGNFKDTFEIIAKAKEELAIKTGKTSPKEYAQDAAWRLCLRAYRGIVDTNEREAGFMRDHIYRSGFFAIEDAIKTYGEDILSTLFVGNLGLHHINEIKALNIKAQKIPELISKDVISRFT